MNNKIGMILCAILFPFTYFIFYEFYGKLLISVLCVLIGYLSIIIFIELINLQIKKDSNAVNNVKEERNEN